MKISARWYGASASLCYQLNNSMRHGGTDMKTCGNLLLGTPQERVRLLRAGVDGKLIEKLYIERNNFKIVGNHLLFNQVDETNKKIEAQTVSFNHYVIKNPRRYNHYQGILADWATCI